MTITATGATALSAQIPQKLKAASVELEAAFLAEMLKSAGLGQTRSSFGGGAGEDQFASFLVQQQARQMARAGGVGLSEIIFNSMMEKSDG
ncbi:flagellar rod assembly protein FlgJ [Ruegeria sp. ANG-R]|uniref:rod-binding protein n=1 Tax=Ruegeria sp. ANG-R TaxID=1577903 RepID=UPI00057C5F26|nr:rod-binding protein [Ruegeria sp. ANG-R]KIC40710.1 flagellar rod assembly protein FlgJ [Ruegeria sp. ANG-R]